MSMKIQLKALINTQTWLMGSVLGSHPGDQASNPGRCVRIFALPDVWSDVISPFFYITGKYGPEAIFIGLTMAYCFKREVK